MRFMITIKSREDSCAPPAELMAAITELSEEAARAGVLRETGGLLPSAQGTRMRITKGKLSVTDGPFTEAKEVVGGFAIYEVASKEEAVEWTRRFMEVHRMHWQDWEGESEIRQMMGPDGCRD